MTRHVVWQAGLAVLGIGLVFVILFRTTSDVKPIEAPAPGGIYREGVLGYYSAINPILASRAIGVNPVDQDLSDLVFNGLTSLDASGQVTPTLATDWDVSEDGTVYEFRLRRGVTWQDGAPFTAADVVFTIQAIQDPDFQGDPGVHNLWRSVGVEQVDNLTVRLILQERFPSFIYYTTIGLLPAHLLGDVPAADLPASDFSTRQPVGTGMFMIETLSSNGAVLVTNPSFWGRKPFMERLEFRFFGDEDGLLASYERGEIDGFHPSRIQSVANLARFPGLQLFSAEYAGYGIVFLNLRRDTCPFFQVVEVRQALLYGLDRQAVIDQVLGGQALVADSPIVPMLWAYDPAVRRYAYDPQRAIGLLDASGWVDSDGDRIRDKGEVALAFELLTSDDLTTVQMAQEMAAQWRALGADVTVRPVAANMVPGLLQIRDFDAVLTELGVTADPDPYPLWHSTQAGESGQNFSGFSSEAADVAMEKMRSAADPKQRAPLYDAFQQIFTEQVPSLLLYYPVYTYAVDERVREVQLSPLLRPSDRFRNIQDWYVETAKIVINDQEQLDNPEK